MTVAELIARLAQLPPDAPVYVRGYESGCHLLQPSWCGPARVIVGYDSQPGYGGPDRMIEDGWPDDEEIEELRLPVVDAVMIDRREVEVAT